MDVLVVDVGGTHVKVLASGQTESRRFDSGPNLGPIRMVVATKKIGKDWRYDVVSICCRGPVLRNRATAELHNLGRGWVGFETAFGHPLKLINDAAMQTLGSYKGGKMLFLGFGRCLGSAMIVNGIVEPMELGHLPYKKHTYEHYVGQQVLERSGKSKWRRQVADAVARLVAALEPDDVVLGGGNAIHLNGLPAGCRAGDNANAFIGGFLHSENATKEWRCIQQDKTILNARDEYRVGSYRGMARHTNRSRTGEQTRKIRTGP